MYTRKFFLGVGGGGGGGGGGGEWARGLKPPHAPLQVKESV